MKILRLGMDPGRPEDLLVPTHRVLHVPAPGSTLNDIAELPYRLGGRAKKPKPAVAFRATDGNVTLLPGLGVTEAAEIQDMAYALWERDQKRLSRGEIGIDREALGLPSRDTFDQRLREHMAAKATYFKQHAVTHPGTAPHTRRLY